MTAAAILLLAVQALAASEDDIRKAVTLYASFDASAKADVGATKDLSTRLTVNWEKKEFKFQNGFDDKIFRVSKDKGISGGALDPSDVLPDNGRVFFPAKGNIAYKKGGWGGTMSMWINTDPNKSLKTKFCDPVQITQKGANNGAIWFDFNDQKPRDMRMGVFPVVPDGMKGITEDDPKAPMVRVPKVDFKAGEWHHIVITWANFDTGKADAHAILYIDGKMIGEVKDRPIAMDWDIEKAGIYVAINYMGLIDEFAIFDRPLTADEVKTLKEKPGLLSALKK